MLILGRRNGDAVTITTDTGEKVQVKVLETKRGFVRLGFEADSSVTIVRNELLERSQQRD